MYDLIVSLGALLALPKWLLQKKYKGTRRQRLGLTLPPASENAPTFWFHMVSMGETRAMIPIYLHLKAKHADATFYFSNTTQTGQDEAKRHFKGHFFILPLDLKPIMKRLARTINPDMLILSESDFWLNQIEAVKERGGRVVLLNGKVSEKSARRFSKVPLFSNKLFSAIDHLCVQNAEYEARFRSLNVPESKLTITGNLKLAIPQKPLSSEDLAHWRDQFGLNPTDTVITIGSTHEGEEELLLKKMPKDTRILLVPRHPERFAKVKARFENDSVTVVDKMGVLSICYSLSNIAIVGGSFAAGIGGHNIFEPIQVGKPVIFGPHMEEQKELVELVLSHEAGIQCTLEELPEALETAPTLVENVLKLSTHGADIQKQSVEFLL